MEWLALAALSIFTIAIIKLTLSNRNTIKESHSYQLNEELLTPAEQSFYGVLNQAVEGNAIILSKVRISDILSPKKSGNRNQWQTAFNRISSTHFDFVICAPGTLHIKSVIELDDTSHSKKKRTQKNELMESACLSAGLTIHHMKASQTYNIDAIRAMLFPKSATPLAISSSSKLTNDKTCPNCSSPLVKKVAKKGRHKGTSFLACSNFPECQFIAKNKTKVATPC